MLTRSMLALLDRAESPRVVRGLDWALTKSTGFTEADWYQRNGFYKLAAALGGNNSYTGRSVNVESGLDCAALYAGTKLISEDLGALPFHTYQQTGDKIERAVKHPLYRALHDLANPEVSAGEMVESLTAQAILMGDGYAGIERMRAGVFLHPWQSEKIEQDRNKAGQLFYLNSETRKTYMRSEVFHLRSFTIKGTSGESLLKRGRHSLGITMAAEEYAGRFFAADAAPGVVISRPSGVPAWPAEVVEEVKKKWKAWHQGVARSHEPAILQDGATIDRIGQTNQESQLLEVRKNQIIEVCMLLRIPPHKMAQLERSTNNNIEEQGIDYITNCLAPWIDRWRRAVYRCLLTVDEQIAGRVWAEHDVAGLLKGDFTAQTEGFRKMLEKGVYTINEVRKWINLNPVDGGDDHLVQLNLSTVQNIAEGLNLPSVKLPMKVGASNAA